MRNKQLDEEVRDFVTRQNGIFLLLTHDALFAKTLRAAVSRHLQIKDDCIRNIVAQDNFQKDVKLLRSQGHRLLFFVERDLNGRPTIDLIKYLKNDYPDVLVVVLTSEVAREKLILLYEIGADNFITKPISVDTLIDKIACTVKPPGQIGALIEQANQMLEQGKFEDAVAVAREILELKPNSPAALILQGDALKGLGRKDEALAVYQAASSSAKMFLEPLKRIAELHKEEGNVAEELKYLERLDKLSPLNIDRKIVIGDNYMKMGRADEAQGIFDDALKMATREAMNTVAKIARSIAERCLQSSPEMSEKYLRQSLEAKRGMLDLSDIETFNRLGISLRKQGKWEQAIHEYRKALKISPNDPGLYYNMAMAFTESKGFEDAYVYLRKAIELNPDLYSSSEQVCFNIAMICFRVQEKERALFYTGKALEMNPNFTRAKQLMTEIRGS